MKKTTSALVAFSLCIPLFLSSCGTKSTEIVPEETAVSEETTVAGDTSPATTSEAGKIE